MPPPPAVPPCSLYLVTPRLARSDGAAFLPTFAAVLAATPVASALVRLAPGAEGDAKALVAPLIAAASARDCALLLEKDARLAARLGADGVHVEGAGDALEEALDSLKPERIVGAGAIAGRDEAMAAGEMGADYVMFGEPFGGRPPAPLDGLLERVGWWAEIFETPCVAYAESVETAGALARAGADFVALDSAIWLAPSPPEAVRRVAELLGRAHAERVAEASR
jgi:thiamine-phosphate pyrophosphorylase